MTASNLKIDGNTANSYQTCIAVWGWNGGVKQGKWAIVNITKYSPTTTRHQNKIIAKLTQEGYNVEYVSNLGRGVNAEYLVTCAWFS